MKRAGVLVAYLLIAALYTWPLLPLASTKIAGNAGDPILTTSILWWNATTLPFSEAWWNPPYYYPDHGVTTFTENLVGVSVFATPIYWLTHNPLTTYNVALYLAWPLTAFGTFLLVEFLTRRRDAAFLAGIACGFCAFRTAELGHIQMISAYWMPIALLALHRFLDDRRTRWLVLFGVSFVVQSLANLYFLLFGAVLIGLWLAYFGTTRRAWRALFPIVVAWVFALLPLIPVMLRYRSVHDEYDMHRVFDTGLGFVLPIDAWLQVSDVVWLWHHVLPDGAHNLFPGIVAILMIALAAWAVIRRSAPESGGQTLARGLRIAAAVVGGLSLAAAIYTVVAGPWRVMLGSRALRMTNLGRALDVVLISAVVIGWPWARLRAAVARRSVWLFYCAATLAMAVLSVGPMLQLSDQADLGPAPYSWLLRLPGFNEVRVPTRFWMLGVMCLGVAAGLSFARLVPATARRRGAATVLVAGLLLADGWMYAIPMADAPAVWPIVEPSGGSRPILELPAGPYFDAAAAYRSIAHRRPVYNGASGYEPQHYPPFLEGLTAHDPAMLRALATLGEFDVVVNGSDDPDGSWARYAAAASGATLVASHDGRATYRIPAVTIDSLGPGLPISRVSAFDGTPDEIAAMTDGRFDTEWRCIPQKAGQWVEADLGAVRDVGGVTQALGNAARDFPRGLAIEVSSDDATWEEVWTGPTAAEAFRSAAEAPLEAVMQFTFAPRRARYVRLRLIASHQNFWRVVELHVHAPAAR